MDGTLWSWMAERGVGEQTLQRHAAVLARHYERLRRRQHPGYRLRRVDPRQRHFWLDAARWMLEAGARPREWVEVQMERSIYPNVLRGAGAVEYFRNRVKEYRRLARELIYQQARLYLQLRKAGCTIEDALGRLDPEFLKLLRHGSQIAESSLFHRLLWEEYLRGKNDDEGIPTRLTDDGAKPSKI